MVVTASAQPSVSNASAPSLVVSGSVSHEVRTQGPYCSLPWGAVFPWWLNTRNDGPYGCLDEPGKSWAMLDSYRSGGSENVHWKYTDDKNDNDCLNDWRYYAEDGTRLIATIKDRLAMESDGRQWCALRVYRSGGVENNQWAWCPCWD